MGSVDLLSAFVVGLLGGVHCVGMCGGIVGALSFGLPAERNLPILLAYNVGRISSYTLAGALMGALGFYFSGLLPVQNAQKVLLSLAGLFLILMGLYLAGWWNVLSRVERVGGVLWRRIEPLGRGLLPIRSVRHGLLLGLLWGWLPCGLVYSALVWTVSSGGALEGASLMLAFGLGTLPNLLLMGVAAAQLNRWAKQPAVRAVAGTLVMVFGVLLLLDAWGR
ncbi:MAG: sulfite exporter TauE/SafE family protein [Gammaproteobacteria bacterium]|jgi:sulfite exporter TauE/SafE|nr:sulfite exporter TauE/SafE family protein [Gammaproteobacteria bacterium]